MRLYVKYCGGCNPTFDRGALVNEIAARLAAKVHYNHPEQADICLLVSGCSRDCAKMTGNKRYISVNRKVDAAQFAEELRRLQEEYEIGEDEQ